MKLLNCRKIRIALVGLVAAIVLGGGSAKADFTFGEPTNLGPPINTASADMCPCLSADGLELYFVSNRPGGLAAEDLWVTTRPSIGEPWGEPVNLGPVVNTESKDSAPCLSEDGLELYFGSNRPGYGGWDIWVTTRATRNDPWGEPVNLGPTVNSEQDYEIPGSLSADGLELYMITGSIPECKIAVARRDTKDAPWGAPVSLGPEVNNWSCQTRPSISSDGLLLVFSDYWEGSPRPGGFGDTDIWFTRRASKDADWGTPVNLGTPVNTSGGEDHVMISADGSTLYFTSYWYDGLAEDLWQAPIIPIVDFNGDGIVDSADVCIMVDHWGEDYSLCDIGPMPWGDGVVDVLDLTVLAEHLFEEVGLVAHWKLDETEGDIAYNSINDNHGIISGNPTWQPNNGQVAGALQFDGVDDYISTYFVLNPADGLFSVFAWVKGGAAGQAILSQENGTNWLMVDSVDGVLKTDLKEPASAGRDPKPPGPPLICSKVITDGDWHRVGFVRDGINRILYVDDVEVARDTAANLEAAGAGGGLYIGAGSGLELGTLWAGLIDDVRIYNRVVSP